MPKTLHTASHSPIAKQLIRHPTNENKYSFRLPTRCSVAMHTTLPAMFTMATTTVAQFASSGTANV